MDSVLRAVAIYGILLLLFRLLGKRSLSQVTTFDFVILLIVGEATQQAILGEDFSLTHAALVVTTLLLLERAADYLGWRSLRFRRVTESVPLVVVEDGKVLKDVLAKEHLTEDDVMTAARESQGLERMDQIKWAVLESSGGISVVPKMNAAPQA
ncbi:DUF421 domain-containing protein [Georgenia subflava]|uniref:DUF421 domain-containing protein n=1 Tax=Georgenia subflava TaxID=1622177 RepID=A0A6N7EP26_9MICO|nr:YetF domain-containing protein [Georgenia subflava]MPV36984.1 DUF421 domain-containing protein [Georgenia subflava]